MSSRKPTKIEAATALPIDTSVTTSKDEEPKVGVLMLNLGGPETGDDVEGTLSLSVGRDHRRHTL